MMYLVQTSLPKKRPVFKALCYVFGVGAFSAENVSESFGILKQCRVFNLRRNHKKRLKLEFSEFFRPLGTELKNLYKARIQRLIDIQSYSGRRHKFAYPVRGQRTHTNARTQKKLHRRWLIKTYERPKPQAKFIKQNKDSLKNKKAKTIAKPKPSPKKPGLQKPAKYKIS